MIIGRLAKINAEHYYLFRTLSDAHTYHIKNVLNPFLSPTKKERQTFLAIPYSKTNGSFLSLK